MILTTRILTWPFQFIYRLYDEATKVDRKFYFECECGVWRLNSLDDLPCWNHEDRKQTFLEALAQLSQSLRNLIYGIAKELRLR